MKVLFNSVSEFVHELERDPPPDHIVRTTRLRQQSGMGAIILVSVIATYINRLGQVVELRKFVGDDWGSNFESSQKTQELAEKVLGEVEQAAQRCSLEIRSGQLVDER